MKFAVLCLAAWLASAPGCGAAGERAPLETYAPTRTLSRDEAWTARGSVQVGFAPWDDIEGWVVAEIARARSQVLVQAYAFTSRPIARALIDAHRRGVDVRVLADRNQVFAPASESNESKSHLDTRVPDLRRAGVAVWLETRYAAAHNKVMVLDAGTAHPTVMTGSYNWTRSAQTRNAENLLMVRDDPVLARRYAENWERHRLDAFPYDP